MVNQEILASKKTDEEKLELIFNNEKQNLKRDNPELYYCLLAIIDKWKISKHKEN